MTRVIAIVGSEISPQGGELIPRSDAAAVSLAVERWGGFAAVTFQASDEALRYALAGGAGSARRVGRKETLEFDVALIGGGGLGPEGELLPARLAQERGAAMVFDVLDVEVIAEGLRVVRDLGRGAKEVLRVARPAVLVMSEDAPRVRYVSRWKRRHARLESETASVTAAEPRDSEGSAWSPAKPRVRTAQLAKKTAGSALDRMFDAFGVTDAAGSAGGTAQHVVVADAAECARQLLRYLGHHGFTERAGITPLSEDREVVSAAIGGDALSRPSPSPQPSPSGGGRGPRAPHSLKGRTPGLHRRPRAYQSAAPTFGKLARRPRPLGVATPPRLHGPFPLTQSASSQGPPHARV